MKNICPICEKESEIEKVSMKEIITVRGEKVTVPVDLYKCHACGESFEDPKAEYGPVELAYREYRRGRGYLQPEEIRAFRSRLGLTQSEWGKLLGFGDVSISRWENGALQDDAHDKALRLSMDPQILVKLIEESPDALPKVKRDALLERLKETEERLGAQSQIERISAYKPDKLSGFKGFDYPKFVNSVLLFCKEGTFTTNLNKLLFYSDFLHFKTFSVSITGLRYAHLPYGPVPDRFHSYFGYLLEAGVVESEEVVFDHGSGERFRSAAKLDLSVFEESELRCMLYVKDRFDKWTANYISDYSHAEPAYKKTEVGEFISYGFAEGLSLELQ
jgi:putative zinc finger/helix-turn-helix YgiT family protein